MQLIANRSLSVTDPYGKEFLAQKGQQFEIYDDDAMQLLRLGMASYVQPPGVPAMITRAPEEVVPPALAHQVEAKAITNYENKAIRPPERKRGRGRPGTPTVCPRCREICPSARAAQRHCRENH